MKNLLIAIGIMLSAALLFAQADDTREITPSIASSMP